MAELTKEKILDIASEQVACFEPFSALNSSEPNHEWIKASLFYITAINEFARKLINELEKNNG